MEATTGHVKALVTCYLVTMDELVTGARVLTSSLYGACGITETHPPQKCRFCGAEGYYGNIVHRDDCRFSVLLRQCSRFYRDTGRNPGSILVRYAATITYCNAIVAFLDDPEVIRIIETDDRGRSNVEKLQPLYTARDQYLTVFSRGR